MKKCVGFGQWSNFGVSWAIRSACLLQKAIGENADKVSRASKTEGRLVFGSDVSSVSSIALPPGRVFMRSKGSILLLTFKQFAAYCASVNVSRTAARRAAARHARKT